MLMSRSRCWRTSSSSSLLRISTWQPGDVSQEFGLGRVGKGAPLRRACSAEPCMRAGPFDSALFAGLASHRHQGPGGRLKRILSNQPTGRASLRAQEQAGGGRRTVFWVVAMRVRDAPRRTDPRGAAAAPAPAAAVIVVVDDGMSMAV
jgi:hypothetical protein